jgi:DNA repair ATPase RecN
MIATIATLPFDELSDQLVSLIEGINSLVGKAQDDNLTEALAQALRAFRDRVSDPQIDASVRELNATLEQIRAFLATADSNLQPVAEDIHAMAADVEATLVTIRGGFSRMEQAGIQVESMLQPESAFRYRLEEALVELAAAAAALRDLGEQLERNPRSLLTGKAEQGP